MTYDDASWHYDTVVEHGLDPSSAATHIGIFFAWLARNGLVNPDVVDVAPLLERSATPGIFLREHCAGEIDAFMLTAEGASFCDFAYEACSRVYRTLPEIARYEVSYAAPDTWSTYDAAAELIQQAHEAFRRAFQ